MFASRHERHDSIEHDAVTHNTNINEHGIQNCYFFFLHMKGFCRGDFIHLFGRAILVSLSLKWF